ncbi:uncharacterized protein LOC129580518 [Sitodiplosis mosellana]|uniref:uncharacterized protein LOC129580518 n=1 Tax=Sitodiplosis mosellana TaxID=263140 RepID=UPI0024451F97|nr:uncharacterized protein LOC129580518 [Sitodiplosis mosellana]
MKATMIEALKRHLASRKIAPILKKLEEKNEDNSEKALKFLCVLDYVTEQNGFYKQMDDHPKLLQQLMSFNSYESFKYYHYHLNKNVSKVIGNRILRCKFCDLIGPYAIILSHTAISHNVHLGIKKCAYCNRMDLLDHPLDTCYSNYLTKYAIDEKNVANSSEFFVMLKEISTKLGVLITRTDAFGGIGKSKKEYVTCKIPGFPNTCTVFTVPRATKKKVKDNNLNIMFKSMVENMYGGNGLSRLLDNEPDEIKDENNEENCEADDAIDPLNPIHNERDPSPPINRQVDETNNTDASANDDESTFSNRALATSNSALEEHLQDSPSHGEPGANGKEIDVKTETDATDQSPVFESVFYQGLEHCLKKCPPEKRAKYESQLLKEIIDLTKND